MLDRSTGTWIDRVRVTYAVLLEIVAVITGGGNRGIAGIDDPLHRALEGLRRFDGDPPRLVAGLLTLDADLATDFDQIVLDAIGLEHIGDSVHPIALGDPRQVGIHRLALDHRIAIELQRQMIDLLERLRDLFIARRLVETLIRAEAPQIDGRTDGDIEGPVGALADILRLGQHLRQAIRQRDRRIQRRLIQLRELRGVLVGRHLPVDLVERLETRLLERRHRIGVQVRSHRDMEPGAEDGAGEAMQLRVAGIFTACNQQGQPHEGRPCQSSCDA